MMMATLADGGVVGLDKAVKETLDGLLFFWLLAGEEGGQVRRDNLVEVLDCWGRA